MLVLGLMVRKEESRELTASVWSHPTLDSTSAPETVADDHCRAPATRARVERTPRRLTTDRAAEHEVLSSHRHPAIELDGALVEPLS